MRLLVWLLGRMLAPPQWVAPSESEADTVTHAEPVVREAADEELYQFFTGLGLTPLSVEVCPNPCGCIKLKTRGRTVWIDYWTAMDYPEQLKP